MGHGDLLRKIHFSKYVIVIASSMSAMINFGINFVVVVVFALINGVSLTWSWLLMVPLVLELYMLSLGIAFFLSAVYVNLRDLNPIWEVVMPGWILCHAYYLPYFPYHFKGGRVWSDICPARSDSQPGGANRSGCASCDELALQIRHLAVGG